jgi:cytochrome c oxidase subunit 2
MRGAWLAAPAALVLAGCEGAQSWLDPRGVNARETLDLWLLTVWVSAGVMVLVTATMLHALFASRWRGGHRWRLFLIGGCGVALPAVVLPVFLVSSLRIEWPYAHHRPGDFVIDVVAWQFWWEVRYPHPEGGPPVVAANEIRIPVGRPVRFNLATEDVIHSFWIPALAGKVDMIPGRVNSARVLAERPGEFRGACFEFCGLQHANMAFTVHAMPAEEFESWLRREAGPAPPPATEEARRGHALFLQHGCGSCHAVRGHGAEGRVAPDLTRLASRSTIGAGMLPNTRGSLAGWIAATQQIKPGANMPSFNQLSGPELHDLVSYLEGLR